MFCYRYVCGDFELKKAIFWNYFDITITGGTKVK